MKEIANDMWMVNLIIVFAGILLGVVFSFINLEKREIKVILRVFMISAIMSVLGFYFEITKLTIYQAGFQNADSFSNMAMQLVHYICLLTPLFSIVAIRSMAEIVYRMFNRN